MLEVATTHLNYDGDVSVAFQTDDHCHSVISGCEPCLGGALREKVVWVDEASCIGCGYCVHVACNTFATEPNFGRSRAFRQDGDSTNCVQEAIDTCPVDCIYWVKFEDLTSLSVIAHSQELQPLGMPMRARPKRKA